MSTGCALDENWVNIVVKNSPFFLLGYVFYGSWWKFKPEEKNHEIPRNYFSYCSRSIPWKSKYTFQTLSMKFHAKFEIPGITFAQPHGGPSEAGDCSHPPHKMATAKKPASRWGRFWPCCRRWIVVILACKQVLDRANLWYRKPSGALAFFGGGGWLDQKRRVTDGWEAGDST